MVDTMFAGKVDKKDADAFWATKENSADSDVKNRQTADAALSEVFGEDWMLRYAKDAAEMIRDTASLAKTMSKDEIVQALRDKLQEK